MVLTVTIQRASGRAIEMTGGLYRPGENCIWSFKEVSRAMKQDMGL